MDKNPLSYFFIKTIVHYTAGHIKQLSYNDCPLDLNSEKMEEDYNILADLMCPAIIIDLNQETPDALATLNKKIAPTLGNLVYHTCIQSFILLASAFYVYYAKPTFFYPHTASLSNLFKSLLFFGVNVYCFTTFSFIGSTYALRKCGISGSKFVNTSASEVS